MKNNNQNEKTLMSIYNAIEGIGTSNTLAYINDINDNKVKYGNFILELMRREKKIIEINEYLQTKGEMPLTVFFNN